MLLLLLSVVTANLENCDRVLVDWKKVKVQLDQKFPWKNFLISFKPNFYNGGHLDVLFQRDANWFDFDDSYSKRLVAGKMNSVLEGTNGQAFVDLFITEAKNEYQLNSWYSK